MVRGQLLYWDPAVKTKSGMIRTTLSFSLLRTQLSRCRPCSQLFGEEDADQEVSPDTADPEAECEWKHDVPGASQYLHSWIMAWTRTLRSSVVSIIYIFFCVLQTGNPEDTAARATASEKDGDIKRVSTKDWARSTGYDPVKLFNKVTDKCP